MPRNCGVPPGCNYHPRHLHAMVLAMGGDRKTTVLVGAGVTTEQALLSPENTIHPDMYTNQLSDLLEAAKSAAPVPA